MVVERESGKDFNKLEYQNFLGTADMSGGVMRRKYPIKHK